jgi:hypothetical protein
MPARLERKKIMEKLKKTKHERVIHIFINSDSYITRINMRTRKHTTNKTIRTQWEGK